MPTIENIMTIPSMKAKNGSFNPKEKTSISFATPPKHLQVPFIQITRYWDNAFKIFICTNDQKCLKTMWITKNLDIFLRIYGELSQSICKHLLSNGKNLKNYENGGLGTILWEGQLKKCQKTILKKVLNAGFGYYNKPSRQSFYR